MNEQEQNDFDLLLKRFVSRDRDFRMLQAEHNLRMVEENKQYIEAHKKIAMQQDMIDKFVLKIERLEQQKYHLEKKYQDLLDDTEEIE